MYIDSLNCELTLEKAIKKWNCKSIFPICGAINHAFVDKRAAQRTNRADLHAQPVGNFARPLMVSANGKHGEEKILLPPRKPVKPHAKEAAIKLPNRALRRHGNIFNRNRRARSHIP